MRRKQMAAGRLGLLARRLRPDGNPLRRTIDRVEGLVALVLLTCFLVGAPLAAVAAGGWSAAASRATERAQAGWRPVRAVLIQHAPRTVRALFQGQPQALVRARWTAPDGATRVGRVYAPSGAKTHHVVTVWTDRFGRLTGYPLQHADLVVRAALAALLAVVVVAFLLGACWLVVRLVLDRRRLAAWDVSWATTGPQWMRRP